MTFPLSISTGMELSEDEVLQAIIRQEVQLLAEELTDYDKYRDYYDGEQKLSFGTTKFKEKFGDAFPGFVDNWCGVVVDAVQERLELEGVNIPGQEDLSKKIWDILRANDLDEQQGDLHEGALVEGKAFAIVWPDDELQVRIDWNPAQLVRVRYSDDDWRRPVFAIKRWVTPSGEVRVTLYTREWVYKYTGITEQPQSGRSGVRATVPAGPPAMTWVRRTVEGESWPLANPFGEIPVVEFRNKGGSELKDVIPQQDAVNYLMINGFLATEFAAFGQRVFFGGVKAPAEGWDNTPGVIWEIQPSFDAEQKPIPQSAETFPPAELAGFINVVGMMLQHMAFTSKTPVRMFFQSDRGGRGDAPSGESLLVDDEPLIDKIENRQIRFGNSWYRVVRLIAKILDDGAAVLPTGEMRWKDPQAKYRAALVKQGATMVKDMGMPLRFVITTLGFSPDEIAALIAEIEAQEKKAEEEAEQAQANTEAQLAVQEAKATAPQPATPTPSRR